MFRLRQVQGVFFRAETSRLARSKGVAGWSAPADGRVEAVFEARNGWSSPCSNGCGPGLGERR